MNGQWGSLTEKSQMLRAAQLPKKVWSEGGEATEGNNKKTETTKRSEKANGSKKLKCPESSRRPQKATEANKEAPEGNKDKLESKTKAMKCKKDPGNEINENMLWKAKISE